MEARSAEIRSRPSPHSAALHAAYEPPHVRGRYKGRMSSVTIFVIIGAVAGGFVQGLSGFAFGLIAMAFWAWSVEPQLAGPMVVFGSLLGQILSVGAIREGFSLQRAAPFIVGGLIGVPLGVLA